MFIGYLDYPKSVGLRYLQLGHIMRLNGEGREIEGIEEDWQVPDQI